MNHRENFASLQILRAVAAWTVVFHHVMQLYAIKGESFVGVFFARYGSTGVDVFFVLSGFVMYLATTKSNKSATHFLIHRIFRVAPAYWFYSGLVLVGIYLFPSGFIYTSFNTKSLIASALFIPSWNPSGLGAYPLLTVGWTLNFEMFFYAALACCMAITRRHFFKLLFIVFTSLPLIYPTGTFFSQVAASDKLYEFLAGALLAILWTGQAGDYVRRHRSVSLMVAVSTALGGTLLLTSKGWTMPVSLSIVTAALLCERYIRQGSIFTRALVRLGDESYSTYLAHCVVIGVALHFTGKSLGQTSLSLVIAAITAATYFVSAASYRWIELSKYLRWAREAVIWQIGHSGLSGAAHTESI